MDERSALGMLAELVDGAGDDAAIVDDLVLTIDMLHDRTDFPAGVSRYTAGWRSLGASYSDVAAMGGTPIAGVAAYGAPTLDDHELDAFVRGAIDVSDRVGASYVGGDLDAHDEFTVATAVVGRADRPVRRSGASPGEGVYVTGPLGRTAVAMDAFERGDHDRGNALFQFQPRIEVGRRLGGVATAMMDSSDGLVRSVHQLSAASECGIALERSSIPLVPDIRDDPDRAIHFGEDFELVCTAPPDRMRSADLGSALTRIGTVTDTGVTLDGTALPDRGYDHG